MLKVRNLLRPIYNKLFRPPYDPISPLVKQGFVVGKNFQMLNEVIIDPSHCWHIEIGDDVTLAPRVYILAHDASTKKYFGYTRIGKVVIGNRVFIGASSIILPGVKIGDDVVIGAGSVVTRDIPSHVVAAGNPCKVLCSLDDFLEKKKREMEICPRFEEEYTIAKNVTVEMKMEMNHQMKDRIGYIF